MNDLTMLTMPDIVEASVAQADGVAHEALTPDQLEAAIRQEPTHLTADDFPVVHRFAPGVYARELTMAAGLIVLGKIHKTRHLNLIVKGRVSFRAGHDEVQTVTAPYTFISDPGIQKILYVHEETTWITIHPTEETDLAALEAELIEPHVNPLLCDVSAPIRIGGGA